MLRKIYAEIEFDQEVADRYAETNGLDEPTPIDHFGKEFGWLEQSGFALRSAVLADEEDCSLWERYINYLLGWAMERAEDFDRKGESPMSYERFETRAHLSAPLVLAYPSIVNVMIADLGNGEKTDAGDRTSSFFQIAKKKVGDSWKYLNVQLIERIVAGRIDKDYYELYVVDDMNGKDCHSFETKHLSENELFTLMSELMERIEKRAGIRGVPTVRSVQNNLPRKKDQTVEETNRCYRWLVEFMADNNMSVKELADFCERNDEWVFSRMLEDCEEGE